MILYCCSDLLWASKIKATADSLGLPCRPARNGEMLAARLAEGHAAAAADAPPPPRVKAVLVDLTSEHAWPVVTIAKADRSAAVLCFGPHGDVDALQQAAALGCSVYSRGALSANLPALLTALAAGQKPESHRHE